MSVEEKVKLCGRCYEEVKILYPARCNEKPELFLGMPVGQYHCPDCGTMLVAGVAHFEVCKRCVDKIHPDFDGLTH